MFNILDNAIILQTEDQLPRFVQSTVSFFNSGYSISNLGYCLLRLILSPLSAISMQVRNSVLIFSFPVRYVDTALKNSLHHLCFSLSSSSGQQNPI